jgi:hypothetical protein
MLQKDCIAKVTSGATLLLLRSQSASGFFVMAVVPSRVDTCYVGLTLAMLVPCDL